MNVNIKCLTGAVMAIAMVALAGCVMAMPSADTKDTINRTLVGTNLTYYSIAGKPMNYTIAAEDIVSIKPAYFEGKAAWQVRVGQGLSWDLTMDARGTRILRTKQLFAT